MALSTQTVTLNGGAKQIIVGVDGSGNEAVAHVNVDASGAEKGISGNPISVDPSLTLTFVQSAALESSHVLKAGAGKLYSTYVTTGATAGYLMLFNATSAPADGAVTPVDCIYCPATATTALDYSATPLTFATGIVVAFSSTGPFIKTASATAFIKGGVL